jgi:hypothetical protein
MTMETVETTEPTQTPPKVWDYIFHTETLDGLIIVKINADSKEEAIELAKIELDEWGDTPNSSDGNSPYIGMPVYLGQFNHYMDEHGVTTIERGEVVDFSSIQ